MRRFILHKHAGFGPTHWDLMLETDLALATWRIEADPLAAPPGAAVSAARIHDHRKAYLDLSGPVSGGRGRIEPQDSGELSLTGSDDDLWTFELRGRVLRGSFELRRTGGDDDAWTLRKSVDQ